MWVFFFPSNRSVWVTQLYSFPHLFWLFWGFLHIICVSFVPASFLFYLDFCVCVCVCPHMCTCVLISSPKCKHHRKGTLSVDIPRVESLPALSHICWMSDPIKNVRENCPKEVTNELKSVKWAGVTEWREKGRTSSQRNDQCKGPGAGESTAQGRDSQKPHELSSEYTKKDKNDVRTVS